MVTGARRSQETGEEPGVIVQAGPGLPQWRYHQYGYSWTGPVEADAAARFVISPPWLTRLWRLAGILLSVLLAARADANPDVLPAAVAAQPPAGALSPCCSPAACSA